MKSTLLLAGSASIFLAALFLGNPISAQQQTGDEDAPRYLADGRLAVPRDYREWVFLSSSIDMSYSDRPVHQFDNVFVPRAAYRAFLKTGAWPEKTVLIL